MNIDEIRKNAPNGATHYKIYGGFAFYHKFNNKRIYVWDCDHWRRFSCFVDGLEPL